MKNQQSKIMCEAIEIKKAIMKSFENYHLLLIVACSHQKRMTIKHPISKHENEQVICHAQFTSDF